jgi:hypothetical protein
MRRWILRFDELGRYLATKDSARVVTSIVKERTDCLAIAKWLIRRRVQDEKNRRDILAKARKAKVKFLHSKAWDKR